MDSIAGAWIYIIEIMSGLAVILMLRWFWWRINAWSEITSMASALILTNGNLITKGAFSLGLINENTLDRVAFWYLDEHALIRAAVILVACTATSILVTLLTKPVDNDQLKEFYKRVRPNGWWGPIARQLPEVVADSSTRSSWLGFIFGVIFLNSILFSVGHAVLGSYLIALILILVAGVSGWMTLRLVATAETT